MDKRDIKDVIKERYGQIARGEATFCCPTCATGAEQSLAVGYTKEDLDSIPEMAILGVGCGNPTALAELKAGETVVDLGAGAGIDVFLAANRVGPAGRVIGVDMTEDMVARGQRLAQEHHYANVEFRLGVIEALPVESGTVDVVISNCVINLTVDKLASFREIHRVLTPGGRILIADLVTLGELPPEVRRDGAAWADCIAGALEKGAYLDIVARAGFGRIEVVAESPYEFPSMTEEVKGKIRSIKVRAFKE